MSNVRALAVQASFNARIGIRLALSPLAHLAHANAGVDRPSAGNRRTGLSFQGLLQRRRGLSVFRRPAHHRLGSEAGGVPCAYLTAMSAVRKPPYAARSQPGFRSVTPRSRFSLALRCKPLRISLGSGVPSSASPNPSIEVDTQRRAAIARFVTAVQPLRTPHLKR